MKKIFILIIILALVLCSCRNQATIKITSNSPNPTNDQTNSPTSSPTTSPAASTSEEALAMEAYKEVLQNNANFYSPEDKKNIYLKDFLTAGGSGYDAELEVTHFTVLDMDGDKIPEVVLEISVVGKEWPDFFEVLHYMDGTVNGYLKVYRGLMELKTDGTFGYSSGAGDYGFAKLTFTADTSEYDRLGYCESSENDELYFINDEPTTADSFESFCDEQKEKEDAEWHEFSQEIVETELPIN